MFDEISVVIITKNSASTLQKTLESVREFDEIVVFDNGSEDETLTIASSFKNVSLHRGSFSGFGPTKNSAVKLARHNWVFSFDSDEIVTPELTEYLRQWNPNCDSIAGFVLRKNFFMGRHVKHGGWGNDWCGLVIAWNDANGVFYKYMKRYADMTNRSEKN